MFNKTRIIRGSISILLGIIMLIFFIYLGGKDYSNKNNTGKKFHEEYSSVDEKNVFVYKKASDVIKLMKEGTGVIYFGFASCPWCQAYAPILNEVAKENSVSVIYYFDIKEDRANNTKEYEEIVALLSDYLNTNDEGKKRVYVPNVTFVKEGKIIANDNETSMESGDPNIYWTFDAKASLKNKLDGYFKVLNDCTTCNN